MTTILSEMKKFHLKDILIVPLLLFSALSYAQGDILWVEVKGGAWQPDATMMASLKSGVRQAVTTQAKQEGRALKAWDSYIFQYQGMTEGGHRFLLINAFCSQSGFQEERKLDESLIIVKDGGTCYFRLKYDPEQKRFYDVMINGEA